MPSLLRKPGFQSKYAIIILILTLLFSLIQCATFEALSKNDQRKEGEKEYVYAGTRNGPSFYGLLREFPDTVVCLGPLVLIDFAVSLAADTILLPITIPFALIDNAAASSAPAPSVRGNAARKETRDRPLEAHVVRGLNNKLKALSLSVADIRGVGKMSQPSEKFLEIAPLLESVASSLPNGYALEVSGRGDATESARVVYSLLRKRGVPSDKIQVRELRAGQGIHFRVVRVPVVLRE